MADVAENTTYSDAATAISQGKRHLLVQDYTAAVTALAEGLEMMSQKLGDCDDALGEPYLLYGRALLGLAREEVGVLGEAVPGGEDGDDDEDGEEEEEEDDDENEEDKTSEADAKEEEGGEAGQTEEKKEVDEKKSSTEAAEKASISSTSDEKKEENGTAVNKTDDKKIEEAKKEVSSSSEASEKNEVAGTSKDINKNGVQEGETSNCNGTAAGTSSGNVDEEEDVNKEDEEEDPGRGIDLQVAWEVLELAKIVFTKRGEAGLKHLAETHRLLGEVAMESDNPQGAIADLEGALVLLEKIEPVEPRALADIHYQLGLAHSLANDFDASIKQFTEATNLLETRIKQLENTPEPTVKSDDPFYSIEGEIRELRELLPAIQEKIVDMKDFKQEACRVLIEGIKNKVADGSASNGAASSSSSSTQNGSGPSGSSDQASACPAPPKPASDISHLVRKKRKHENETEEPAQSPCKKLTP
ncbi:protein HGV2 [Venturia canescens]|uniref:protein HGV2 n=1 Tax=Venturia canescens TaxID=32260 RepID=UPI001C9C3A4C|nr:protein HGV2 [Venturia canescens]